MYEANIASYAGAGMGLVPRSCRMQKSFDSVIRQSSAYSGQVITGNDTFEALSKALATGVITGYGDATPLRLENLDSTMTEVLVQGAHLKQFRSIPRVPSIKEIYQWMRHLV